jgi:hypothetical protein
MEPRFAETLHKLHHGTVRDDTVPVSVDSSRKKKKSKAEANRENGKLGGRPPIEIDLMAVKRLASMMATDVEIATVLGISERSVSRAKKRADFQAAIDQGRNLAKLHLRRVQFDTAMSGNVTMLIFLSKAYLGMSDRAGESTDDPISEIRITVRRPSKVSE